MKPSAGCSTPARPSLRRSWLWRNSQGWTAIFTNTFGSVAGSVFLNGCVKYPANIVTWGSASEASITIDDTYTPKSDNRQALYCGQKYDNNVPVDQLGDDFECVLLIHQDEEQIDGVHIQIGNENSDYAVTNDNRQYIDLTITSNDIMLTDIGALIRNWNQQGYFGAGPTGSKTIQDIVSRIWHDTMTPQLSNSQIQSTYQWTQLMGGDANYNFFSDMNNDVFNKAIVFKISGLNVINANDYLTADQLKQVSLKNFLSYTREHNINVFSKNATVTIYTNRTNSPYATLETTTPLVISKKPSVLQRVMLQDGNIVTTTMPEQLGFHAISTMISANQTKQSRLIANLVFQQIIKAKPQNQPSLLTLGGASSAINGFFFGIGASGNATGLFNNPGAALTKPVFWVAVVVILFLAFLVTLMVKNVRRSKGSG